MPQPVKKRQKAAAATESDIPKRAGKRQSANQRVSSKVAPSPDTSRPVGNAKAIRQRIAAELASRKLPKSTRELLLHLDAWVAAQAASSNPTRADKGSPHNGDTRSDLEARVAERTAELTDVNRLLSEVISRRERVEQSLRESEALTRAIFDTAVDAIITIDDRGTIITLNHAAERLFGYAGDELIGRNVNVLMPDPYATEHDGYLSRYIRTGVAKIIGIGREVMGKRKDGSLFPLDLAVSEVRFGAKRTFTGVVRDLTEHKQLEREIMEATEREQRRIGQDLHDGLGQQLTGIGFMTETLSHQLAQTRHPLADDAARITSLVGDAIQQSRGLAHGLYPVEPQPGGLAHALRLLSASMAHAYKVKCTLHDGQVPAFEDRTAPTHL